MNPDYMPWYGKWEAILYIDSLIAYDELFNPGKRSRQERLRRTALKRRQAREQRRKMKRHNRRRK